jgi:hypothetical protein
MILIFICCFVTLFDKNVLLITTLDFPIILNGQFSSSYTVGLLNVCTDIIFSVFAVTEHFN